MQGGKTRMFATIAMAQQISPEAAIAQIGVPALIIGLLIGSVIAALIIGLLLKFVGASVLGHSVKYGSAFLAIFVVVLVQGALSFALVFGGVIDIGAVSTGGTLVDQIMPYGPVVFIVGQVVGLLIMAWAIRTFLKGPSDEQPSWSNAFMIGIIMIVILIAFNFLLLQLGAGQGMR